MPRVTARTGLQTSRRTKTLVTNGSIPIHQRVELPEDWIPADSRVEIDAKINAGAFGLGRLPPRTRRPMAPSRS